MNDPILDRWAEKLLDVGRRNNLVNFHDSKSSSAEIILPDSETIFKKVCDGDTLQLVTADQTVLEGEGKTLSKEECIKKSSDNLKSKQALVYAQSGNPFESLKRIAKNAATSIEETGVNISYIAFGFVHWNDTDNAENISKAPVLLLPIKVERKTGFLERKSSAITYQLKPLDDDVILNSTFNFILQKNYGIELPEYNDEELSAYLEKVSAAVSAFNWKVTNECKIGIFSFQKISMYQDFKENKKLILESPTVKSMLGMGKSESSSAEKSDSKGNVKNPLTDLHCVVDADSSQMKAIELAKFGQSFVLQGPPGTGKSQTITNMISECLASGKKVLFVSEKLAALEVVYEKLRQAELSDFCLELHSNKANKKDFIAELCRVLKKSKTTVSEKAKSEIEEKEKAQTQLDLYESELHLKRPIIERSLYQLLCLYYDFSDTDDVVVAIPNLTQKGEDFINESTNLIEQFSQFLPAVGKNYKDNVWHGYNNPNYSFETKTQLQSDLKNAIEYLDLLLKTNSIIQKNYGVALGTFDSIFYFLNIIDFLNNSDFITPALLEESVFNLFFENYKKLKEIVQKINSSSEEILSKYRPEILDDDIDIDWQKAFADLRTKYSSAFTRKFDKDFKNLLDKIHIKKIESTPPKYEDAVEIADKMNSLGRLKREFDMYAKRLEGVAGSAFIGVQTNWTHCDEEIEAFKNFVSQKKNYSNVRKCRIKSLDDEKLSEVINSCNSAQQNSDALKRVIESFDSNVLNTETMTIEQIGEFFVQRLQAIDLLDNYCQFNNLLLKIKENGLTQFIDEVLAQNKDEKEFANIFKKQAYSQWIASIISASPVLNSFNRISQDKAVLVFNEKDTLQFDISKAMIKETLSAKRPSLNMMGAGSEVSMLLREGEKKQKQKNIRTLLCTAGKLIQNIKPCFLMSPLSVSTYLEPEKINFDVVIFDEASQIFPEDAIGAIYRAKQVIVVGDSKQMPPSNFFSASIIDDDYSDDEDIGDFESVLDLCSVCMPQKRLLWHYRSRFEQLIAFSNKNFYDSTLVSFPSVKSKVEGIGVDYYFSGGTFDRKTHSNQKEAEFVADLIFKTVKEFPNRSLGVVAFSVAQQDLIEKILSEKRAVDDSCEEYFSGGSSESFFIKNLETVQGDERDIIIFSVAYGPDEQGKIYHNFGPLNRGGGERRLNVAVTRAKWNVKLVSSMHFTDINLSKTQSRGAALLREYLDYAENGRLAPASENYENSFEQAETGFEDSVFEFLKSNGFSVERKIGCSELKIDIGVKRPDSEDFFLAIECDGATYHASKNTRDRDRLRKQILERMGWKFYRIWSVDWFKNNASEKQRLLEVVQNALTEEKKSEIKSNTNSFEEEQVKETFEFPKIKMLTQQKLLLLRWQNPDLLNYIKKILETESPVSEEFLLQQIAKPYYQQNKVTSSMQEHFETNLKKSKNSGITRKDGFLYLDSKNNYMLRTPETDDDKRDIKQIALEELAAGMLKLIEINIAIEKKGLFKKVASLCGVERLSPAVSEHLEQAFELIKEKTVTDGNLSVRLKG